MAFLLTDLYIGRYYRILFLYLDQHKEFLQVLVVDYCKDVFSTEILRRTPLYMDHRMTIGHNQQPGKLQF